MTACLALLLLSIAGASPDGPGLAGSPVDAQLPPAAEDPAPPGVVESVVVHGNHTTPTADVLAIAGITLGEEATASLIADITRRLVQSGRFAGAEVRRRFLAIDDATRVVLVIVVEERAGVAEDDLMPGPKKRLAASTMWLPVVGYQEGYGFTYGARLALVDALGRRTRISVPLTWGGERQAQVEVERGFASPAVARVFGGGGIHRRRNPFFGVGDTRQTIFGRVESAPRRWLRASAGARVSQVSFGEADDRLTSVGADIVLDTRRDPALPRNAAFVSLGVERLAFDAQASEAPETGFAHRSARRVSFDARGYLGLVRQTVLVLRAQSATASRAVPAYEAQLLGGMASLRGYDVGSHAGDNLAAASAEVLMPLSGPLDIGRVGVKVFADTGAVYASGAALADQRFRWGYGAGAFLTAAVFSLGVDVGWREGGGTPNAHVQLGVRLTR